MKNRPIHENLDTSFVNLSALVKYLRRRQFAGIVKVQLNGYKADIILQEDNQMKVSEHDQISGRVSEGEEALQRLLIRAREPGGTIDVFQQTEDSLEIPVKPAAAEESVRMQAIPKPAEILQKEREHKGFEPSEQLKPEVINKSDFPEIELKSNGNDSVSEQKSAPAKQTVSLPDFPFRLTNKVEERARKVQTVSNEDWETLLNLTVELLGSIDKTLAQAKLDFSSAFRTACAEIADDYPFLNPANEVFSYSQGKIKMSERISPKIFTGSIIETIRRILEKLESNPKFAEIHRAAVQTILAVMNKREGLYEKFEITPQLKRILGV